MIDKKEASAYFNLGNISFLTGEIEKGIEYYNKAIANGFEDTILYYNLGMVYEELGNNLMAIRNYSKAISKEPLNPEYRLKQIALYITNNSLDEAVAKNIDSISYEFTKNNNIKINPVSSFFSSLITGVINSSAIGQWVNEVYNKGKNVLNDLITNLKHWYRSGGGRYIVDFVVSIGLAALAVAALVAALPELLAAATLGAALFAAASVITAIFTILNHSTNIVASITAYNRHTNGDPAWANMYGQMDKLTAFIRFSDKKGNLTMVAGFLDCIEHAANIVLACKTFTDLAKLLTEPGKTKGFKSLKKLFGSQNNDRSVGILGSRFKEMVGNKKKFTANSIMNGLKSIFTDKAYTKEIWDTTLSFKDELIDLAKYNKMTFLQGKSLIEKLATGTSIQKSKAAEILKTTLKNDFTKFIQPLKTKFTTFKGLVGVADSLNKGKSIISISELFPKTKKVISSIKKINNFTNVDIYIMLNLVIINNTS